MRRAGIVTAVLVVLFVEVASAAWLITSPPSSAAAGAASLPKVANASASFSGGDVTVSWDAVQLQYGATVDGYQVLAYPSGGGQARTPSGTCAGVVTGTTCTDGSTPPGTWEYRVTANLASWVGPQSDAATVAAGPNDIVAENQLPGSPSSEWQVDGAGDPSIQGFTTDISTNQGGTVEFKVDTTADAFRIDIYRLGWYGGDGARKVDTIPSSSTTATAQPNCQRDATGIADCGNWSVSATWQVPSNATSGVYIGRLVRPDTDGASHVPFVVRDDNGGSDLVMQTSDTTWQAYNRYGGASLYTGDGPGTGGNADGRAYAVSYNRPITVRDYAPEDSLFNAEYPMIRWLERNGYDVSYIAGVDTHRSGAELLEHKAFLSVGHDEYWSGQQRANVEAARNAGVNLAFFSGNEVFWRTRYQNGIDGSAGNPRTLVAYKETHNYPNNPDPTNQWTGTWRDPRDPDSVHLPENGLTGTIFMVNSGTVPLEVPAEDGQLRLWRNSSVASSPGADTLGQSIVGYEWDEDLDNGFRPYGQIDLSRTVANNVEKVDPAYYGSTFIGGSSATHSLTMHKDRQSGALVFGAGTVQWAWGLDGQHDRGIDPAVPAVQQATINLFADMGAQPATLQGDLTAATQSTDAAPPTSTITSPADGSTVPAGSAVTVTGTAADTGGLVGGIEVSTDDGATWHPASGRASWQYTFVAPNNNGASVQIRSRATDDSLNTESPGAPVTVTTAPKVCDSATPCSIFSSASPGAQDANDGQSIELGVRFRTSEHGLVTGIRFFKPGTATGSYAGNLWTNTGTLLGSAPLTEISGAGWQVLPLTTPVAVSAGTTYLASYYSQSGQFAYSTGSDPGNLNSAVVNEPLTALAHGTDGANAVYKYGGGFPASAPGSAGTNYWADVTFESSADTTAPTVLDHVPVPDAVDVPRGTTVSATFSEPVDAATVTGSTFTLEGPGNSPVPATVNVVGAQATLTPSSPLAISTEYTATLTGGNGGIKDLSGNALAADDAWVFTTTSAATTSIFGTTYTGAPSGDSASVELGVKFRSDTAGSITSVRFYKPSVDTQLYTARLYTVDGQLLGESTPTALSTIGWQEIPLPSAVPITPGTTYVASVFMPTGGYAVTSGGLASEVSSPPLTALASGPSGGNGVYAYGANGGFPASTYNDANYWIDVAFAIGADTTAPTVTSVSPPDNATGVQVGANITGTFSEPVKASTVDQSTFTLTGPGAVAVPASVVVNGATATLTPDADLEPDTVYTATLTTGITDEADNALATEHSWSFTTVAGPTQDYTIFGAAQGGAAYNDSNGPIEVGVKFRSSESGSVTTVRFLKQATAGGTFTGKVYAAGGGAPLGQGTLTLADGTTGWQEIPLTSAVPVAADTTYVVSYLSPNGDYVSQNGGLSTAVSNPPLTALANGTDGPNGVYAYGGGFPDQSCSTCNGPNYWVDVVMNGAPLPPDLTPPTIQNRVPAPGETDVSPSSSVTVRFDESIDPASVTDSTFTVTGPGGPVPGSRSVNGSVITFTPTDPLTETTSYSVGVKGGTGGVADLAGNPLAADGEWSFTTSAPPSPRPDPNVGPGGPVLLVDGGGFGGYLPEIMRAEGLNLFTVGSTSALDSAGLAGYDTVVLGETALTAPQVSALTDWVTAGGNLVALRPDPALAGLLGLTAVGGTVDEGYLKVDTSKPPGEGIVGQTMQFHGAADRYTANAGTQVAATLYSDSTTATAYPAVTLRSVGGDGGSAAAFTYDLARSVVLTRQGNPAWVNQNRDGQDGPNRSDDLFFGAMASDPQPDYVDLSKVAIPQADEQQRLLANVLTETTLDALPMPRFWYLPRGDVAAIVMTADEHDGGNVPARFDQELGASPNGCSVADWECIRSTSYLYPSYPTSSMTAAQALAYQNQGFEISLHPYTGCASPTREEFADQLATQLGDLATRFPGVDASVTSRNHCIAWTDYTTVPEELAKQGIHLDTNYYYWPPGWVNDTPGMFTGSGFAQRFATTGGDLIDVYQATTDMTDESGQSFPYNAITLMDRAINLGYYGTFVANLHSDGGQNATDAHDSVVAAAQARGVPVISARQLLTWTDGRNSSSFGNLDWNAATGTLSFTLDKAAGSRGLEGMLPLNSDNGSLQDLAGPGGQVTTQTRTVKGVDYAVFPAAAGAWTATYSVTPADTTPPTVTSTVPSDGAVDIATGSTVTATFSEPVTGVNASRFTLEAGGSPVSGSVTYSAGPRTATFTPDAALDTATDYTVRLATGITDASGNPLAPLQWSFTTAASGLPNAPGVTDTSSADFNQGSGTGVSVVDGDVVLTPDLVETFDGSALPSGWTSAQWSGGEATVAGGQLSVSGSRAYTDAVYAPGRSIEFEATLGAEPYQHAGLATDAADVPGYYWAFFSTSGTSDKIFARTNNNGVTSDTEIIGQSPGSPHRYRIEWKANEIVFSIDGAAVYTAPVTITEPMRPFFSDYSNSSLPLTVDWVRMSPYGGSGTFDSQVFDAGQTSSWGPVDWDADVPSGTSLQVQVRTGETPTPDGSWSSLTDVANGLPPGSTGRYLQYRLLMATADPLHTLSVRSVSIG